MTPSEKLLPRLDKLHKAGAGRWSARCCAHEDKGPSLAIRELDDGQLLLHCFAGCSVEEIVTALGLTMEDLFPERPAHGGHSALQRPRKIITSTQALDMLHAEAQTAAVCAANLAYGLTLTDDDRALLLQAAGRIAYVRNEVMT